MRDLLALVGLLLLLAPAPAGAQEVHLADPTFSAASIDPLLALGADAVVRLDARRFEIHSPRSATYRVHVATTVFNDAGRERHAREIVYHDAFRRVKRFEGRLRDADGKVIRKLRRSDLSDVSAVSSGTIYSDARNRVATLVHSVFPYTVEFEYEVEYDGLLHYPAWFPQPSSDPVEQGVFEVAAPPTLAARHRAHGIDAEPELLQNGEAVVLRWRVARLPQREPAEHGPSWIEQVPSVEIAPSRFEIEGYAGAMDSWEAFGQWYRRLLDGRTLLPAHVQDDLRSRVADAPTEREKVARLYALLQRSTRYISVQLGIGGWQPYDAGYVLENGYGDCKALSNYMMAMLEAVGIDAYPALISRGMREADKDPEFPTSRFNHLVLYVPLDAEPLWLECTSQTLPFGHVAADIADRWALVVRPDGGELVRTPRYDAQQNRLARRAELVLARDGSAEASLSLRYEGQRQDGLRFSIVERSYRERMAWLQAAAFSMPTYDVVDADLSSLDRRDPHVDLHAQVTMPRMASRSGTRMFVPLGLFARDIDVPEPDSARTLPIVNGIARSTVDTVEVSLPAGYDVEALPGDQLLETPFATFEQQVERLDERTVRLVRRYVVREPRLPADAFDEYRAFLQSASRAENPQMVLVRR